MTDDLRAALSEPDFYPHRPRRVQVHETHISWVFLAGRRAYKLKKPVLLPFLDYSTPARRREMCREEVRLNRRLAPDLYVAVRAVAATGAGFELAAEDDQRAVDYLVEMRRFDERRTLAAKLRRGEGGHGEAIALARVLASFHAHAARVPAAEMPTPALALERRFSENCHELLALIEQPAELGRVLALARFAHAFTSAYATMLDARAWGGFTREVHGDLRAEHVLLGDTVQIVDCIEFDRRLRELDVADDLAFLIMDLAAHGGERFAAMLMAAYREAGGEPGEDRLIFFHAIYRALVSAKIELLRASQHPPDSAAHGHHSAAGRDLLALAERCAWRARLPLVIVICGLPAAGKSKLATALAAASGLAHLSSDVTRKRLAGLAPRQRGAPGLYDAQFNLLTYAELGRRTAIEARAHGGALVDATFRHRADRDAFADGFRHAAPLLFVECQAPASVLCERAARRDRQGENVSDASAQVVAGERGSWEPLEEVAAEAHLSLRSDRPLDALLADLAALLDRRIGGLHAAS